MADRTVSVTDSVPSSSSVQFVVDFKHYMARRADVTQELQHLTDAVYDMALQMNGSSCGVLALMTAEAVIHSVPLSVVDSSAVSSYRKYIKTRLLLNSRLHDVDADAVCDMPLCRFYANFGPSIQLYHSFVVL